MPTLGDVDKSDELHGAAKAKKDRMYRIVRNLMILTILIVCGISIYLTIFGT